MGIYLKALQPLTWGFPSVPERDICMYRMYCIILSSHHLHRQLNGLRIRARRASSVLRCRSTVVALSPAQDGNARGGDDILQTALLLHCGYVRIISAALLLGVFLPWFLPD